MSADQKTATSKFYGAQCPSYPDCTGGCGLGCTHEIEGKKSAEQQTSPSVYFVPRAKVMGGRFDRGGEICLLMDYAFPSEAEAGYWGSRNWFALHALGFGYEGVEKIDTGDTSPFPHITGRALGIGNIAVIGGPRWDEAFAKGAKGDQA